ncbi:MAG: hypothetical protein U0L37_05485, partial [Bacteroidales bacterium]|nr:hypothetical protein [Bacteroidales bacterium]
FSGVIQMYASYNWIVDDYRQSIIKKIDYSSIPDCLFEMQNYSVKQLIYKCFFGWWGVKVFAIGM